MKRRHLFEFEDFGWFPSSLRNLMTDYLRHVVVQFRLYEPVIPLLKHLLKATQTTSIVDLASGGGGPWQALAPVLAKEVPGLDIRLTDLYPNRNALQSVCESAPETLSTNEDPVNALQVPPHLKGLRTQFLSLHHFRPDQVQAIFRNAIDAQQPIATFEFQDRTWAHALQFAFSPLFVFLLTLRIRPFTLKRLFFTYVLPIVPFFIMWDGVVSVLRTYRSAELKTLLAEMPESSRYQWEIATVKQGTVTLNYVLGQPKEMVATRPED